MATLQIPGSDRVTHGLYRMIVSNDRKRLDVTPGKNRKNLFVPADFVFAEDFSYCLCPAGKKLYRSGCNVKVKNLQAFKFKGPKKFCVPCKLRKECLRHPDRTEYRQVAENESATFQQTQPGTIFKAGKDFLS
jgi:hypothetical protein